MLISFEIFNLDSFKSLQCLLKLILKSLRNPYVDLSCILHSEAVNSQFGITAFCEVCAL